MDDDEKQEVHRTIDVVTEHCGALYLHDSHEEIWYMNGQLHHLTYCPGTYPLVS